MKTRQESDERMGSMVPGAAGARRRTLLAKVHIAAKELGLPPADYRALLMGRFGVPSAGDLSTRDMEKLLDHFVGCGWRPEGRRASLAAMRKRQIFALQARARQIFSQLEDRDERRLHGLCEKICGTNDLASCRDAAKLRRILAVLAGIKKRESTLH